MVCALVCENEDDRVGGDHEWRSDGEGKDAKTVVQRRSLQETPESMIVVESNVPRKGSATSLEAFLYRQSEISRRVAIVGAAKREERV